MRKAARRERLRAGWRRGSLEQFDAPDSTWNRAAAATGLADPFCARTEWQLSFHETFAPDRHLCLYEAAGSVLAFAERFHPAVGILLEPVETLWLFGCPLLGGAAVEVLDALLDLHLTAGLSPAVMLSGLLPNSPLLRSVGRTFRPRYELVRLPSTMLCSAALDGGLDGYLSRRTAKFRRRLREATGRADRRGVHYERCVPRSAAEANATYARMLAVERSSWKGIGACGMAESPSREFYAAMLRRLAHGGGGRVMFARYGDRDIGFIFGGLAERVYRGQQFSYVEDWSAASIGNLLQFEQLRWLCEEGVERYDMGPLMDYKHHWTELHFKTEARLLRPVGGGD